MQEGYNDDSIGNINSCMRFSRSEKIRKMLRCYISHRQVPREAADHQHWWSLGSSTGWPFWRHNGSTRAHVASARACFWEQATMLSTYVSRIPGLYKFWGVRLWPFSAWTWKHCLPQSLRRSPGLSHCPQRYSTVNATTFGNTLASFWTVLI